MSMQSIPLSATDSTRLLPVTSGNHGAEQLTEADRHELLRFLNRRPIHCAYLLGLILDNDLISPLNRGTFYAYRNYLGEIQGVALLGHAIIIETANDEALKAFAQVALICKKAHLIMCEEDRAARFWRYYSTNGETMRRLGRQLLFELRWPVAVSHESQQLRLATIADIEILVPVHAEMAFEESGVDPRKVDSNGF